MKSLNLVTCLITFYFHFISTNVYGQSPSWIWAKSPYVTGSTNIISNHTATDANGNVYVVGIFTGTVVFGTTTLNSGANRDIFLAKYDAGGNALWANMADQVGCCPNVGGIFTDSLSNVYIIGNFHLKMTFGIDTLISPGTSIFIVKYDKLGNIINAKGTGFSSFVSSACGDQAGNIYITGQNTANTAIFDQDTLTNVNGKMFIAKFDSGINALWAVSSDSTLHEVDAMTEDFAGNVYVTGVFTNHTVSFAGISIFDDSSSVSGQSAIFLVKYSSTGNIVWAKTEAMAIADGVFPTCLASDPLGQICLTGFFTSPNLHFDPYVLINSTDAGTVQQNMFIVKFDASGNAVWAKNAIGWAEASAIITDTAANIYVTGNTFDPYMIFGTDTLQTNTGLFLAKYGSSGNVLWELAATGARTAQCLSTYNSASVYLAAFGDYRFHQGGDVIPGFDLIIAKIANPCRLQVLSLNSSDVKCHAASNGSALLTANAGIPPYSYLWSNGDTTQSVTNLAGGVYKITVTDVSNCSVSDSVSISEPAQLVIANSTIQNVSCPGEANGWIGVYVSGGTGLFYRYNWNTTDSTFVANGLSGGIYYLTVTDSNGCNLLDSFRITENPRPVAIISQNGGVLSTDSFSSYQWLNAGIAINGQNAQNYVPLNNGNYSVVVTDSTGCSDTSAVYHFIGLRLKNVEDDEYPVSIFPNPASYYTIIDYSFIDWNKGDVNLEISNPLGQIAYKKKLPRYSGYQKIDVSGFATGVYNVFVVRSGEVVGVAKLIRP
ncbi:MAG: repeat-containing protein [Bacteroidota bacterium]|nr:repeat-containing protein [Bacteroidota bacterium]